MCGCVCVHTYSGRATHGSHSAEFVGAVIPCPSELVLHASQVRTYRETKQRAAAILLSSWVLLSRARHIWSEFMSVVIPCPLDLALYASQVT